MEIDFKMFSVRLDRERWVDSQGNPHEWISFVSEPIAHMEPTIHEYLPKYFDLHSKHLEESVWRIHVASTNDDSLHSEI